MGLLFSFFGGTGRTDDPDPVTKLTSRDKYLIKTSWEPIRRQATKNGCNILITFFTKFPEVQKYFPFRDLPLEEMEANKGFQAHSNNIMYAFNSLIDNLDDTELLVNLLIKLGKSHKLRKAPEKSFWDLKDVMVETFSQTMSPTEVESWTKLLEVAMRAITEELRVGVGN